MNNYKSNMNRSCGCQRPTPPMEMKHACDEHMSDRHSHNRFDKEPLAMSYVPWQHFGELYPPCKALYEGTAFPDLNQIFCGVRG